MKTKQDRLRVTAYHTKAGEYVTMVVPGSTFHEAVKEFNRRCLQPDLLTGHAVTPAGTARITKKKVYR